MTIFEYAATQEGVVDLDKNFLVQLHYAPCRPFWSKDLNLTWPAQLLLNIIACGIPRVYLWSSVDDERLIANSDARVALKSTGRLARLVMLETWKREIERIPNWLRPRLSPSGHRAMFMWDRHKAAHNSMLSTKLGPKSCWIRLFCKLPLERMSKRELT